MSSPDDSFPVPAPPDLPSFTIGDSAAEPAEPAVKRAADPAERHIGTGLVRHAAVFEDDRIDPDAAKVVRRLERAGYQAYLVGGCVRDLLLGSKPKDFDIATDARPDRIMDLFPNSGRVGAHFGVVLVRDVFDQVEVATFRSDHDYLDGRHPEQVRFESDPREDVLRRDFTINGLMLDPDTGRVLDFVDG